MSSIKEQIGEYLKSEGLMPKDKDYGFFFRYQMLSFYIQWSESDERFLKISLPSIFSVDENNRQDVLEVANKIGLERKVVKCVVPEDDVWIVAEQLMDSNPNFEDIIPRTLNMLVQARDVFYEKLKEL